MVTGVGAGLLAFGVTVGSLVVIEIFVEQRSFVLADQYLAFLVGDVLLSVAVAIGWWGNPWSWSWWWLVPAVGGLVFGVIQAVLEVRGGAYTPGESLSPSHLWHQVVTYPVMAVLLSAAVSLAWPSAGRLFAMAILAACWGSLLVYDASHPKNPHVEFEWPILGTPSSAQEGVAPHVGCTRADTAAAERDCRDS